jgi:ribonuclease E
VSSFENEDGSSNLQHADTQAQPDNSSIAQVAAEAAPVSAPLQTHVTPTYQAPTPVAEVAPASEISAMAAPVVVTTPAPAEVATPVALDTPAPAVAAPSPVAAPAPVADLAALHAIVRAAGLQWVESDPIRVAQTLAQQPVINVKLGRERKPAVVISSEPLIQVETRPQA